jgi:DNA-binding NtrC family response regulator
MLRILISDDEPVVRELFLDAFRQSIPDAEVRTCIYNTEVEGILDVWLPDVVLLDTRQALNGIALGEALQRTHPNMRVIAMSGDCELATVAAARNAGIGGFLKKPCDLSQLTEFVESKSFVTNYQP